MRGGALAATCALAVACGRGTAPVAQGGDVTLDAAVAAEAEVDPRVAELWARAKEGDADDLARLVDRVGSDEIVLRGRDPAYRLTAVRALAYASGFDALPWLAEVASKGDDVDASAALESVATMASAPRRATDPEDALALREGCDALLALAKDVARPRGRRVGAVRALRMLSERGAVKASDIPTDVDAK